MRSSFFFFLTVALVSGLAAGCNSRRTARPRTDSGPTIGDAGGGTDGGGVVDGGGSDCRTVGCPTGLTCNTTTGACMPGSSDCTTTGCPTGQTCNTGTGVCESSTPCGTETVDVADGLCAPSTVECVTSGGDFATCVDADPDPAGCAGCIDQNLISCANDMGCQTAWNQVACCRDDNCAGTLDDPCVMGACASQWTAFTGCLETLAAGACVEHVNACGGA